MNIKNGRIFETFWGPMSRSAVIEGRDFNRLTGLCQQLSSKDRASGKAKGNGKGEKGNESTALQKRLLGSSKKATP